MTARRARLSRTAQKTPADASELIGRLRDLEERIVALETRLSVSSQPKRRRCPGCLLELPKGRRGPSCVWCGFYFEAVKAQAVE